MDLSAYLHLLHTSEPRLEYHAGHIRLLDPGGPTHSAVNSNTMIALANRLEGTPHRVYAPTLRISIPATRRHLYPDITIITGRFELDPADPSAESVINPLLIVEVLSPTTETYDRTEKLKHYRRIPSLCELVFISSTSPMVETFHRSTQADPHWRHTTYRDPDSVAILHAVDVALPFAVIYANADLNPR